MGFLLLLVLQGTGWDIVALSDTYKGYAGSCGRCYEVKCKNDGFKDGYGGCEQAAAGWGLHCVSVSCVSVSGVSPEQDSSALTCCSAPAQSSTLHTDGFMCLLLLSLPQATGLTARVSGHEQQAQQLSWPLGGHHTSVVHSVSSGCLLSSSSSSQGANPI